MNPYPRLIDPQRSFDVGVEWIYNDIITNRLCPGIIVGLSGTDSLVAFMMAYKAFEKAGKPERVFGIHFAPSEDFLYDHPEAEAHLWFSREIIPWVRHEAPKAGLMTYTDIDWRMDGLRWGMLAEMAVLKNEYGKRIMRQPEEQFWLCGTRNRTEDVLFSYSNASMMASIQPIVHLWKSEVLQVSQHLGVPSIAITKSCEVDCICGRDRTPAKYPRELDLVLMADELGELDRAYVERNIPKELRTELYAFVLDQRGKHWFKQSIPYRSDRALDGRIDELVWLFEDGGLDLRQFNHRKHLYVAWCYLNAMTLDEAIDRYVHHLRLVLDRAGQGHRFNLETTKGYFQRLDVAMKECGRIGFDELLEKAPQLLNR